MDMMDSYHNTQVDSLHSSALPCAVCGWAEDIFVEDMELANDVCTYSQHFRTESHLRNYVAWCVYRNEQELGCDYMDEWLVKNSLGDVHQEVLCTETH